MNAKKCDRCKEFYDLDSKRSQVSFSPYGKNRIDVDLCPECTADFESWIRNVAYIVSAKDLKRSLSNADV